MNQQEEKVRLYHLLSSHEGWVDILKEAIQVEKDGEERYRQEGYGKYFGFEWFMVHTPVPTLHKMVVEKVLDITLATRSGTHFKVREPELVLEVVKALEAPTPELPLKTIPDDLFNIIVGHNNTKTLVKYAIEAEKPVHLLLTGPPASAKTLFLMELARLPESYYCVDQETECLSIEGWRRYDQVKVGDLILTKNLEEGKSKSKNCKLKIK